MQTNSFMGRSLAVLCLLGATLMVTLVSAFLLVPESSRAGKFNLSLAAMLVAECVAFLGPVWFHRRGVTAALPVRFALGWLCWAYLITVAGLAALALTDISLGVLAVLHLVVLLGLVLTWGASQMAAGHIEASHDALAVRQSGFPACREQFERLSDRIQSMRSPELEALQRSFRKMRDELRYAGAETLPGAEAVEGELIASLTSLEESVELLESATRDGKAEGVAGRSAALEGWLQQFRLLLRRREERLRALR